MKKFLTLAMIFSVMVFSLAVCTTASAATSDAPDYSQKASWCRLPSIITKDIDTFYIYSTSYVETSFKEGAPDYASLDTPEMVERAQSEYVAHATVYEDSTNVFAPYYRQAGSNLFRGQKDTPSKATWLGLSGRLWRFPIA